MAYFQVEFCLCISNESLYCTFIFMQIKLIFIWKVLRKESFWKIGKRQLGNGLLACFFFFCCCYFFNFQVELHVHLDGAVRIQTIIDLARYDKYWFSIWLATNASFGKSFFGQGGCFVEWFEHKTWIKLASQD